MNRQSEERSNDVIEAIAKLKEDNEMLRSEVIEYRHMCEDLMDENFKMAEINKKYQKAYDEAMHEVIKLRLEKKGVISCD